MFWDLYLDGLTLLVRGNVEWLGFQSLKIEYFMFSFNSSLLPQKEDIILNHVKGGAFTLLA